MKELNLEVSHTAEYGYAIEKMVSNYVVMRILKHYNIFKSKEIISH